MQGDEEGWSNGAMGYLTVSVFKLPFTAVSITPCLMMSSQHQLIGTALSATPQSSAQSYAYSLFQAMAVHLSTNTAQKRRVRQRCDGMSLRISPLL